MKFLEKEVVSILKNLAILFPDPVKADRPNRNIWFQQESAPPPILQDVFVIIWILYIQVDGLVEGEWPSRAPDLTPLD